MAYAKHTPKSNGYLIYRGPSEIDGQPIIVIATGLAKGSRNGKTGALIQTWILREDISPIDAVNSGADVSICGNCGHRGNIVDGHNVGRSCYVLLFQAPRNIWESYRRGIYPTIAPDGLADLFAGRGIRLGAYGDPGAVPFGIWHQVMRQATFGTGYTHQYRDCDPELARYCMASADSPADRLVAKALGYRVFRVRGALEPVIHGEVICPASKEAGVKTNCQNCKACGGNAAKARADIVIISHGAASKRKAHATRIAA